MMADLSKALQDTLRWEGGYTVDTGGKTKFGISANAYPNLDIPNLTLDQAKEIYRLDYWNIIKGAAIKSQLAAGVLFDFAVNAGIKRAAIEAQKALISLGSRILADGKLGPETIAEINRFGDQFAIKLTDRRVKFYEDLAAKNPEKYSSFLKGWKRRALSFVSSDQVKAATTSLKSNPVFIAGMLIAAFWITKKVLKGA